ncbi:helix-turn-helix domain-containing protein [Microbacterium sp. C7(2022)]|uniref:helix-turn-helix domain-containing protein n=1 Tax=Microbacterium sp. C7(2022) TaxID=2992759 RepID=UPI00237BBA03|nr:helix-turn-helix domain-containing protein [Microbacterium sp. C7(2022)]MDE0545439.1 helix-turn-helix domain-containing protein [Microbacterium sp. C7(2022)]
MSTPRFYFIPEVASELRRSEAAVRWLIHTGALSSTKLGGRRVVTAAQLDEFFASAA